MTFYTHCYLMHGCVSTVSTMNFIGRAAKKFYKSTSRKMIDRAMKSKYIN